MAKSEGVSNTSSVTICQKYFFRILSQKKRSDCESQKSGFRFDPKNPLTESGFYGFMIRFWICPKRRKIRFWIRKSGFGFSQKNAPLDRL